MATTLEIPILYQSADQSLNVTLDNQPYTLRITYNVRFDFFTLSINEKDGNALISGIKMVHNYPLINRFQKTTFKGDIYLLHKGGKDIRPTFDNVGSEFGLYYYDQELPDDFPVPNITLGSNTTIWDEGNTIYIDDGQITNWV